MLHLFTFLFALTIFVVSTIVEDRFNLNPMGINGTLTTHHRARVLFVIYSEI